MSDADNECQDEFLDPEDRGFVIDEDMAEFGRYLGGDMTEEERRAMEKRAKRDGDFWRKVGPLVGLFALDLPVDVKAFRETFHVLSPEAPSIGELPREPRPAVGRTQAPSTVKPQVPPVVVGPPYVEPRLPAFIPPSYLQPHTPLPALGDRVRLRTRDAVGGAAKVAMYTAAAIVTLFFGLQLKPVRSLATRALTGVLLHADTADVNQMVRDAKHDTERGFMPVDGQGPLTEDGGAPDGPKTYVLDDHSRAVVLPGSRIAFRIGQTAYQRTIQRGLTRGRGGHFAVIDGEVVFTAFARWAFQTMTARIEIDSGMVAIRRLPHGTVTQVNVGQGMAWVFPRHTQDSIAVHAGEVLMIPSTGAPRLGRDTTGFPLFGDTAHSTNTRRTP